MKLSGAEALPLPGGLQDIRKLKIESFEITGKNRDDRPCTTMQLRGF